MKKIIAVFVALVAVAGVVFGVVAYKKSKEEQPKTQTTTTALSATEATTKVEVQADELSTTFAEPIKTEKITFGDKNVYTIEKTDFEKNFSEETLMEIQHLIGMEFGVDDYYNWDGTPYEILNDICHSSILLGGGITFLRGFDNDTNEYQMASEELKKSPHYEKIGDHEFLTLDMVNEWVQSIFGPDARKFKPADFNTFDELFSENPDAMSELSEFEFLYVFIPESNMVAQLSSGASDVNPPLSYIYDVRCENNTYIVKAVTGSEDYRELGDFNFLQKQALEDFNYYTDDYLTNHIYTIGIADDGDLYMKSVERRFLLPDNVKMNYKVTAPTDSIEIKEKYIYSKDYEVVDTIKNGAEFYCRGWNFDEETVNIITENYVGKVERKYVTEIE